MSLWLPETGFTLLSSAAFVLAGDLLLGRRPAGLACFAESFLVGGAVSSSLLIPLSAVFPHRALALSAVLLAAAALAGLLLRLRTSPERFKEAGPATGPEEPWNPLSLVLLALTILGTAVFVALNWRYSLLWDGFQSWAARAQILFHEGDYAPRPMPGDYFNAGFRRPPLVPFFEALVCLLRGRFDFSALKPVFLPFYLAMLASVYRAARSVGPRSLALAATALLAFLPVMSTREAAGGYADMPQAACVAAVVAAALSPARTDWRSPLPWLIAGLTTIKDEGIILAVVSGIAVIVAAMARRRRPSVSAAVSFLAAPAVFLGLRSAYLSWVNVHIADFGSFDSQHLSRAISRIPSVVFLCGRELLAFGDWGFFWVALAAAFPFVFARNVPLPVKAVAGGVLLALAAYTALFLFTDMPLALHVDSAYARLLQQIAPAAVVIAVAGYRYSAARADARSE